MTTTSKQTRPNPRKNVETIDPSPMWIISQPPLTMDGRFLIVSMKGGARKHVVMRDGKLVSQEKADFGTEVEAKSVFAWVEDRA